MPQVSFDWMYGLAGVDLSVHSTGQKRSAKCFRKHNSLNCIVAQCHLDCAGQVHASQCFIVQHGWIRSVQLHPVQRSQLQFCP